MVGAGLVSAGGFGAAGAADSADTGLAGCACWVGAEGAALLVGTGGLGAADSFDVGFGAVGADDAAGSPDAGLAGDAGFGSPLLVEVTVASGLASVFASLGLAAASGFESTGNDEDFASLDDADDLLSAVGDASFGAGCAGGVGLVG